MCFWCAGKITSVKSSSLLSQTNNTGHNEQNADNKRAFNGGPIVLFDILKSFKFKPFLINLCRPLRPLLSKNANVLRPGLAAVWRQQPERIHLRSEHDDPSQQMRPNIWVSMITLLDHHPAEGKSQAMKMTAPTALFSSPSLGINQVEGPALSVWYFHFDRNYFGDLVICNFLVSFPG